MLKFVAIPLVIIWAYLSAGCALAAGEKLTLTITPPLFKMNMEPGDVISSAVKVVNNNSGLITVYADAMDFKGKEEGGVDFSVDSGANPEDSGHLLSSWVDISAEPIIIPPQQSKEVPFKVKVPMDAEPGGHYAAIAVSTKQPDSAGAGGSLVKVSSMMTSLLLVKIKGEIEEKGKIVFFGSEKGLYKDPSVKFNINFYNEGNVHLQPRGEIIVYNPYNKELGRIKVNDVSDFGNVLPDSGRQWDVEWKGEKKLLDTGRHRAMLYLSYGEEKPQAANKMLYFWVIDIRLTAMIVGGVLSFIITFFVLIRIYVRRSVIKAQAELISQMPQPAAKPETSGVRESELKQTTKKGMIDLRAAANKKSISNFQEKWPEKKKQS